jgi:hypothetical protein
LQVVGIVIQGDLSEIDFILSFGEEEAFFVARVEGLGVFSLLGASPFLLCCVLPLVVESCILKGMLPKAGCDLELAFTADCYLKSCASLLAGRVSLFRGCVSFLGLRGRRKGSLLLVKPYWKA